MTLVNKKKRKVTSHVNGRIIKLAEEAIALGLIASCELTSLGYKIRKTDVFEDVEFSSIATGIYLLQLLGKIK